MFNGVVDLRKAFNAFEKSLTLELTTERGEQFFAPPPRLAPAVFVKTPLYLAFLKLRRLSINPPVRLSETFIRRRILITGGAGFIGSAVVQIAVRDVGHQVLVVDKLTYASNLDSIEVVRNDPNFRFVRADICDRDRMRALLDQFSPDVVEKPGGIACRSLDGRSRRVH